MNPSDISCSNHSEIFQASEIISAIAVKVMAYTLSANTYMSKRERRMFAAARFSISNAAIELRAANAGEVR